MAQIIKPKRGTATPTTSDIASGEFAVDTDSQEIYINDNGTIKLIGTSFTQADVTVSQADVTQYNGQIAPLYSNIQSVSVAFTDLAGATVQTSAETFVDSDTVLMTAAAIEDRYLQSYTETDTLSSVTGRGATTTDEITTGGLVLGDDKRVKLGASTDLQLFYNGTTSNLTANNGTLFIDNFTDDGDIVLRTDNGDGSTVTDYIRLDGSTGETKLNHLGTLKLRTLSTGVEVTGDIDVSGEVRTARVDFDPQSSAPTADETTVWYDNTLKSLAYYTDITDVIHEIGQEEHVRVYNNTGSTISKGDSVHYNGNYTAGAQDVGTVAPSNATDASKFNCIGLAAADIANNSYGYVILSGVIRNIDTSNLTAGANFFVGLTDGSLQTGAPSYPNFPMCMGWCVISNATTGVLIVDTQAHTIPNFRVNGSQYVAGDVRIEGDLVVTGSTISTSTEDINIGGQYTFLQQGDTIGESGTTFSGTGLDDGLLVGTYTGTTSSKVYYVRIDGTGTPDTFEWSLDNFSTTEATAISITGTDQLLSDGISVRFGTTTGHTVGDIWSGTATPSNIDTGIISNRNTGAGGSGLDYIGLFYDVSDTKWKAFDQLDTKPTANINTADASFGLATFAANTFEGNLSGNVTGNVTGNASSATALQNARNFSGSGKITLSTESFNGTGAVTFTTSVDTFNLADLSNVSTASPTNNQALVYNNSSSQWEPQDQSGSGGQFTPTKLDAITTVNGQSAYTMQSSSVNYTPSSTFALLVSLNGIIQEPGTAFTTSSSTITFSPALATNDVIDFIIDLGKAVEIGSYTETDTLATVTGRGATTTNLITVGGIDINGEVVELTRIATVSGTTALDPALGTIQRLTLSGNTTFTDSLANGEAITLMIDDGAGRTITWPTIAWIGGTPPTLDTTNLTVIQVWKINNALYGAESGVAS